MIPALATRLTNVRFSLDAARAAFGPCWVGGVMKLETARREPTVFLGLTQRADGPLTLIDWQTAPLAEVFFSCREGEHYELAFDERPVRGRLLEKALVRPEAGALAELWCELEGCPGEVVFRRSRTAAHSYILRVRQAHALHTAVWLSEALERLVGTGPEAEPLAPIAVILRIPEQARHLASCLSYPVPAHLALDGDFAFKPGVVVTCVVEVKGLEFDLVALPDAGEGTWPDTAAARRSFSVAVIRTCHCLVLLAHGPWSPLLS